MKILRDTFLLLAACVLLETSHASNCVHPESGGDSGYVFATCLFKAGDYSSAAHEMEKTIAMLGTSAQSHHFRLLGDAYRIMERTEDAMELLNKAVELDEDDIWSKNSLSTVLFQRAMELSPTQLNGRHMHAAPECKPNAAEMSNADRLQSQRLAQSAISVATDVMQHFNAIDQSLLAAHKRSQIGMMMIETGDFEAAIQEEIEAAAEMLKLSQGTSEENFYHSHAAHVYANVSNQLLTDRQFGLAHHYADLAMLTAPDDESKSSVEQMIASSEHIRSLKSSMNKAEKMICERRAVVIKELHTGDTP